MKINKKIVEMANNAILEQENKEKKAVELSNYIIKCKKALICPVCGEKLNYKYIPAGFINNAAQTWVCSANRDHFSERIRHSDK